MQQEQKLHKRKQKVMAKKNIWELKTDLANKIAQISEKRYNFFVRHNVFYRKKGLLEFFRFCPVP